MERALRHARHRFARARTELREFLSIPSISTLPEHAEDVRRCAHWLADHLATSGFLDVAIEQTERHPIVIARSAAVAGRPTLLAYAHYDVQPPGDERAWTSPPFSPEERNGSIWARGASDDKAQLMLVVEAARAFIRGAGALPVNLVLVFEGEEEVGSTSLPGFLRRNRERVRADAALVCDTWMDAPGRPALTVGMRGTVLCELLVEGGAHALHSGEYGGAVENPLHILARCLASLHHADRRVAVPGFYDGACEPRSESDSAFDMARWLRAAGVPAPSTANGWSPVEATTVRPALDVHGVSGGHQGEGVAAIVPAAARATFSARIVPDQCPDAVFESLRRHVEDLVPGTVRASLRQLGACPAFETDARGPAMRAAAAALETTFGRAPVLHRAGGSIPVVAMLKETLGLDAVLMGFGLAEDAIHAPDEHFALERFERGTEAVIRFLDGLSRALLPRCQSKPREGSNDVQEHDGQPLDPRGRNPRRMRQPSREGHRGEFRE